MQPLTIDMVLRNGQELMVPSAKIGQLVALQIASFAEREIDVTNGRVDGEPLAGADTHWRVRHDRVAEGGNVTLRHKGRLHHIALGRDLTGTRILLLVADLDVRIINRATGELYRHLTIDPDRLYHGTGRPPGPRPRERQRPDT